MQDRDGRIHAISMSPHPSEKGSPDNKEKTVINRFSSTSTFFLSIERPVLLTEMYWEMAVNVIRITNRVTSDIFMGISFSAF